MKECIVCGKSFPLSELYPTSLIREPVINTAKKTYPQIHEKGYICYPDKRKLASLHFEKTLLEEIGELTDLEKEVLDSLKKQEILSENINEEFQEHLSFGEKLSDRIALFGGSWKFISIFVIVLVGWMLINSFFILQNPFDAYPYIFLNLILSCLAAIQAPIIMMSQNRQAAKDRLSQEHDYQVNLKSELQIRQLNSRLELFMKHYWHAMLETNLMLEEILKEIEEKD